MHPTQEVTGKKDDLEEMNLYLVIMDNQANNKKMIVHWKSFHFESITKSRLYVLEGEKELSHQLKEQLTKEKVDKCQSEVLIDVQPQMC